MQNEENNELVAEVKEKIVKILEEAKCTFLVREERLINPFNQSEQKACQILIVPIKEEEGGKNREK